MTTHLLTRLLPAAALVGAGLTLAAPPAAQALDDVACGHWSQKGYTIQDPEYGEVYVIEARCDVWVWTPPPVATPPKSGEPGQPPPGSGGGGDKEPPPTCADVRSQRKALEARLSAAQAEALAGEVTVSHDEGVDARAWSALVDARADAQVALDAEAAAKTAYIREAGVEGIEVEQRNGHTVVRPPNLTRASVDASYATGRALLAAMDARAVALEIEREAAVDYAEAHGTLLADRAALDAVHEEIASIEAALKALEAAATTCTK